MKTAGIIKIIVGCVVLLALAAGVAGVYTGRALWKHGRLEIVPGKQSGAETVVPGAGSVVPGTEVVVPGTEAIVSGSISYDAAAVREIELDWIAGSVTVTQAEGDEILISETSVQTLTEAQKLRCTLSGGKLQIHYCDDAKNVWRWFSLGNYDIPAKHLTLALPASLNGTLSELDIDSVSADVYFEAVGASSTEVESVSGKLRVSGLHCRELSLSSTSGDIIASDCSADELDVETVSGKSEIRGAFGKIEASGVSGRVDIVCTIIAGVIEAKTVSGNISVTLPAGAEFTANLETVSGDLTSEFPCTISGGRLITGSGANRYEFESVSGDVRILQGAG